MKQLQYHPVNLSKLWTSLLPVLGGCALTIFILIGVCSGTATAVTIVTERSYDQVPSGPQHFSTLEGAVDQYLSSIPADYYGLCSVAALKSLMASSTPFMIEVRTSPDYQSGHIIGAINIPLKELGRHLEEIPTDQEIVLYCSTGYRSAMGVMALHLQGFTNVQGFPPSFAGWKAAGEPVSWSEAPGRHQA